MLNEFIEKVMVYEGKGRGNDRRQRIDIHMNFIGAFEVPAEIITPMELEEQRRIQEDTERGRTKKPNRRGNGGGAMLTYSERSKKPQDCR